MCFFFFFKEPCSGLPPISKWEKRQCQNITFPTNWSPLNSEAHHLSVYENLPPFCFGFFQWNIDCLMLTIWPKPKLTDCTSVVATLLTNRYAIYSILFKTSTKPQSVNKTENRAFPYAACWHLLVEWHMNWTGQHIWTKDTNHVMS